jgi:hypothetical protein
VKSFFKFIGAVVSALVAGALVVALQAPIARHFSGDRLVAEVHAGRWLPFPGPKGEADPWLNELGTYAIDKFNDGDEIYTAEWNVSNNGSKKIDAIKIEFREITPLLAIVYNESGRSQYYKDPKSIKLDDLSPGSFSRIKIISIFDQSDKILYDSRFISTYSSEGPIWIRINGNRNEHYMDPITNFIDMWIVPIVLIGLVVAVIALSLAAAHYGIFAEAIMKDSIAYRKEKKRFDQNPSLYDYSIKK